MTKELLDDFFANKYATAKKRRSEIYKLATGSSLIQIQNGIIEYNENNANSKAMIHIRSLHGLSVDEWFLLLKSRIICLIKNIKYEEGKNLIYKSMDLYIFSEYSFIMQLYFLGIIISIHTQDLDFLIDIIIRLSFKFNYTAANLLYFLCKFIPDYYNKPTFTTYQRNIQRITRQVYNFNDTNSVDEDVVSSEYTQNYKSNKKISELSAISSFLPRYLFKETVDYISILKRDNIPETSIFLASIYLSHSKSRTLVNKLEYAKAGIKLLKDLPDENNTKFYNLGKAYHFYGYYAQAEIYYFKVLEGKNEELRRMAIFNLSLIFTKTKSKEMQRFLLSKLKG